MTFGETESDLDQQNNSNFTFQDAQSWKRYDKSRRMKAIRRYVRKRDRYRCTSCGIKQSPHTRIIVHHVVPVSQGGDHHPDNLKCKCDPCHAKIHPWL